jgi:hypothetical protein
MIDQPVIDVGFALKAVTVEEFDELLRVMRVVEKKQLNQRRIDREGAHGTVLISDGDPIAFYSDDGQHYVRSA